MKRARAFCLPLALVAAFSLGILAGRSTIAGADKASAAPAADTTATSVLLDVPPMCQYPEYPTGCEVVTAAMALNHVGEKVTVDILIDCYLPQSRDWYRVDGQLYGPDPQIYFAGDPRSRDSYGCFAPVIRTMLVAYVGSADRVLNTSHTPLEELCRIYIDKGLPVMVWATMDMRPVAWENSWLLIDRTRFTWPGGEHCLLLVGYDAHSYYFNDPIKGAQVAYPRETAAQRYTDMGQQSLVITR